MPAERGSRSVRLFHCRAEFQNDDCATTIREQLDRSPGLRSSQPVPYVTHRSAGGDAWKGRNICHTRNTGHTRPGYAVEMDLKELRSSQRLILGDFSTEVMELLHRPGANLTEDDLTELRETLAEVHPVDGEDWV
jgi:hypothetical protein